VLEKQKLEIEFIFRSVVQLSFAIQKKKSSTQLLISSV